MEYVADLCLIGSEVTPLRAHQLRMLELLEEFDRVCGILKIPYILFAGTLLGAVRHGGFIPWDDDLDVLLLRADYDRFLKDAPTLIDAEKFYLQAEFSEHWPMFFSKLRANGTACLEPYHPKDPACHQGIYMDIFPCDNAASTKPGRLFQFLASKVVIAKCLDRRGYDTSSPLKRAFIALCRYLPMAPALALTRRRRSNSGFVHSFLGGARAYGRNIYPRQWLTERTALSFEGKHHPVPTQYDAFLRHLYDDYSVFPSEEQRRLKRHAILTDLERSYEHYAHYRDTMTFPNPTRSIR